MKKEKSKYDPKPFHPLMEHLCYRKTKEAFDQAWQDVWLKDLVAELYYGYTPEKPKTNGYGNTVYKRYTNFKEYPLTYAIQKGTFEFLHGHFPGANGKSILEMLEEDSLSGKPSHYLEFYNYIRSVEFLRKSLKPIYLELIKNSPEMKSLLKIDWALSLENHFIKFIQTRKEKAAETEDTTGHKTLMGMLSRHKLTDTDLERIKGLLLDKIGDEAFTPNPPLAALYFAFQAPRDNDDNAILKNHLMINHKYTADAKEKLETLIKKRLTNEELTSLKKHIYDAVKLDANLEEHGKKTLTATDTSPFTTIVRMQIRNRSDYAGNTYRELNKLGLFGARNNPAPAPNPGRNPRPDIQPDHVLVGDTAYKPQ